MGITMNNAIEEFLIEQQIRGNSPRTLSYYRQNLGRFSRSFSDEMELDSLSLADCQNYYLRLASDQSLSTVTIQTYIRAVRAFLSWCFEQQYITTNLTERFKLPKAKRKAIDVLTDAEALRLFACFNPRTFAGSRNYCICALMYDSGLRQNEVITLQSKHVHIAEGYVIVDGKGDKQRIVPLGLQSKKALIRYCSKIRVSNDKTPLFVKGNLTPIQKSTLADMFRKLKVQTGIPRLRAHLLRHTFATRYLQHGGDIYSLQQILGHTSLEMVKKYLHLIPENLVVSFSPHSPLDNVIKSQKNQR